MRGGPPRSRQHMASSRVGSPHEPRVDGRQGAPWAGDTHWRTLAATSADPNTDRVIGTNDFADPHDMTVMVAVTRRDSGVASACESGRRRDARRH